MHGTKGGWVDDGDDVGRAKERSEVGSRVTCLRRYWPPRPRPPSHPSPAPPT